MRTASPTTEAVSELVSKIRADPRDHASMNELVPLAVRYLSEGPGKNTHIFCDTEGQAEGDLHTCMLRIFSYTPNEKTEEWLKIITECITTCTRCLKGYEQAREDLADNYLWTFSSAKIGAFNSHIDEWEISIALSLLERYKVSKGSGLNLLPEPALFAAVSFSASSASEPLLSKLRSALSSDRVKILSHVPLGIVALLMDESYDLRSWAQAQAAEVPSHDGSNVPARIKAHIVAIAKHLMSTESSDPRRHALWSIVPTVLQLLPSSSVELSAPIYAHLDDQVNFSDILQALSVILRIRGAQLFDEEGNEELPYVIMSGVLDNPSFVQTLSVAENLSDPHQRERLLGWVHTLLSALHEKSMAAHRSPPPDPGFTLIVRSKSQDRSKLNSTSETSAASASMPIPAMVPAPEMKTVGTFELLLKLITNFFFERVQLNHVSKTSRTILLQEALRLLSSLFDSLCCTWWDSREKAKATHFSALNNVLELYATTIANLGIGGLTPGGSHKVNPYDDVRQLALHLLSKVLRQDAQHVRESVFKLASYATGCFDAWQKRRKRNPDPNGPTYINEKGPTADELYIQARKRLPPSPVICEQIWQASYRALANHASPSGVTVMVEAVTIITSLEQVSAVKYALTAPPGNTALPNYNKYKNDLDAHVGSLTRSLDVMREGFAETMAERAEFMSEVDLQSICCLSTSGMVALGMSPNQQLHKTSQIIVRQAFISAETRADCFRLLFRSNPQSALRGLNNFLHTFIETMRTLPEANAIAKWVIRSATDVLEVLCGPTDGLVNTEAPFSIVRTDPEALQRHLPEIWKLMCVSICVIFEKTPRWAKLLPEAELTVWMRDVTIFGRQMVDSLNLVNHALSKAVTRALEQSSGVDGALKQDLLNNLSLPLEAATSWLRLNKAEILVEVKEFINAALSKFPNGMLPLKTKETFLGFIKSQLEITDIRQRRTLLSSDELMDLRHRVDPDSSIIIIDDDDSDDEGEATVERSASSSSKPRAIPLVLIESPKKRRSIADLNRSEPASSSRLSLALKSVDHPKRNSSPPRSRNKYQGAASIPAGSKLSRLRDEFRSTRVNREHDATNHPIAPAPSRSIATSESSSSRLAVGKTKKEDENSDSSDSDDAANSKQAAGLAALSALKRTANKVPAIFKPSIPVRRTQILVDPGMQKAMNDRAEAERKRKLREPPDYTALHRSILCWDYYGSGEHPDTSDMGAGFARVVPQIFSSAEAYGNIFGPLLLMECWAQFQQAKEEITNAQISPLSGEVMGRTNVDCWTDITIVIPLQSSMVSQRFSDADIVLVADPNSQTAPGNRRRSALAKVEKSFMRNNSLSVTLRLCLDPDRYGVSNVVSVGLKCSVYKLFSLTTVHREFAALTAVQHYPLIKDILAARIAEGAKFSDSEIASVSKSYRLNKSQATAILSSLAQEGFSLVQGPPGTGKTSMIVGLVAAFMRRRRSPGNVKPGEIATPGISKKVLLCAPSNAAIDELALRLSAGLEINGMIVKPNVIRFGNTDKMNVGVRHISLASLLQERLDRTSANSVGIDTSSLHVELKRLRGEREGKMTALEEARGSGQAAVTIDALLADLRAINSKRQEVMSKLDDARDKQQAASRQQDADSRRIRLELFNAADVICCTLAGAGHDSLAHLPFEFETVIIDEAAQAVELSALIPLRYGARQCIMVGDPKQLPPTVISGAADRLKYSQSLFVRMFQQSSSHVAMLNIQYRMHPSISAFPSAAFYNSAILDGPHMAELTEQPWHEQELFLPFKFFDTKGRETHGRSHSLINREEAEVIIALVARLTSKYSNVDFGRRIGVITMYKDQVFELKRAFKARFGAEVEDWIDFNTVDGFQGQEKDIIILSCVRAGNKGVGFLADQRRVNVAMTRAKSNLFIVGSAAHLRNDPLWSTVISHAEAKGVLQTVTAQSFSSAAVPASVISAALSSSSSGHGSLKQKNRKRKQLLPEMQPMAAAAAVTPHQLKKQASEKSKIPSSSPKDRKRRISDACEDSPRLISAHDHASTRGLKAAPSPVKRPRTSDTTSQDSAISPYVPTPSTSAATGYKPRVDRSTECKPRIDPLAPTMSAPPLSTHQPPPTHQSSAQPAPSSILPGPGVCKASSLGLPPPSPALKPQAARVAGPMPHRPPPPPLPSGPSKQALSSLFVKKKPPKKK